jgi:hypothetical protein
MQNAAAHEPSDGVLGDLEHHGSLSHGVHGRRRLADAARVGSEQPLDGSLDRLFDARFDG